MFAEGNVYVFTLGKWIDGCVRGVWKRLRGCWRFLISEGMKEVKVKRGVCGSV